MRVSAGYVQGCDERDSAASQGTGFPDRRGKLLSQAENLDRCDELAAQQAQITQVFRRQNTVRVRSTEPGFYRT